ncbi:MAG: neutral/alkaline non-lysosomal ceramidase N-terminal domain-containing protein [Verrucomicrobiia bacterium]|jgi:neutral ceramidase
MNCRSFFLACVFVLSTHAPAADWKAAAAKVLITPQQPMWMGGYSSRKAPGEGKTTEIYAKVLVLQDKAENRQVTITFDLIGVPRTFRLELAKSVEDRFAIRPDQLFLNASHTHSGPMIRLIPPFRPGQKSRASFMNVPDDEEEKYVKLVEDYLSSLQRRLLDTIGDSISRLEPADLRYSKGRAGFAMNRRLATADRVINAANPNGPVDHEVPVLQVRSAKKKLLAILFGYACHNTTVSYMTFSGDYAGWAQQYLEADNPETVAMFVMGCGGDQNPYPRRNPVWASRHGRALANAVEAGLIANPTTVDAVLKSDLNYIDLKYATPPTRKQLEERAKSKDKYERRHGEMLLEYLDTTGALPTTYSYPVQVIKLGSQITLVTLGGETVIDYSLRLKRELKGSAVWVAGYSNDLVGYVPSERVLREGGYEGGRAMRYVRAIPHTGPWAPGIEENIISTVHRLNDSLR